MWLLLDVSELAWLSRPVKGQGGFQSLLRALAQNRRGQVQFVPVTLVERIQRYARKYGKGGFQGRLRSLAQRLQA